MEKINFTRREFLNFSWRMAVVAVFGAAASACSPTQSTTPTPKPTPYEIPTVDPLDISPYRDLARFYPTLESLQINGEAIRFGTAVPTTIYNFTRNRTVYPDSAKSIFDYFESLADSNRSIDYSFHFQMFDKTILQLIKRPVIERFFVLVPSDGPNLPTNFLSKPDAVTAVTLIIDKEPTKSKSYTFIKLNDILDSDQSKDPSDFRKFVTEVCQSTIFVKLHTEISEHIIGYQNLSQEIFCNSISYEIEDRYKNVPYDTHTKNLRNMGFAGFPVIVSSQKDYLSFPQLGDLIK